MSQTDYVQTRCPKCGAAAWGHVMQTVPCSACGQPIAPLGSSPWAPASPYGVAQAPGAQMFQQPAAGMPPGAQAFGTPPGAGMPPGVQSFGTPSPAMSSVGGPAATSSGGASVNVPMPFGLKVPVNFNGAGGKAKLIGGVAAVAVLGVGGAVVSSKLKGEKARKGLLSYSSIKMDVKKIDADMMIPAVASTAQTWKKDAVFWSINLLHVRADGTIDASGGAAVVEYASPKAASSYVKKERDDSIKKFAFGPSGVDFSDNMIYGFTDRADIKDGPPLPHCGIKNVVKQVKGLTGDKTVRVSYDPGDQIAWRVMGDDPKIDTYFSLEDCSPVQRQ